MGLWWKSQPMLQNRPERCLPASPQSHQIPAMSPSRAMFSPSQGQQVCKRRLETFPSRVEAANMASRRLAWVFRRERMVTTYQAGEREFRIDGYACLRSAAGSCFAPSRGARPGRAWTEACVHADRAYKRLQIAAQIVHQSLSSLHVHLMCA